MRPYPDMERVAQFGNWEAIFSVQAFTECMVVGQASQSIGFDDPSSIYLVAHYGYEDVALISMRDDFYNGEPVVFETNYVRVTASINDGGTLLHYQEGEPLQSGLAQGSDVVVRFKDKQLRFSSTGFNSAMDALARHCSL